MIVAAIIQARMGSSRLPGKSLMGISGRPLIEHVIERVLAVPKISTVVLATSASKLDEALYSVCLRTDVSFFRGSEWDVLGRMRDAARFVRADVVMRVTGDCPFFAPDVGADVLDAFLIGGRDYVWNDTAISGFPDGTDVEVFTRDALEAAAEKASDAADREHVTPWIRANRKCGLVANPEGLRLGYRKLSVDRPVDLELARKIHEFLEPRKLTLADTMTAYDEVEARSAK